MAAGIYTYLGQKYAPIKPVTYKLIYEPYYYINIFPTNLQVDIQNKNKQNSHG